MNTSNLSKIIKLQMNKIKETKMNIYFKILSAGLIILHYSSHSIKFKCFTTKPDNKYPYEILTSLFNDILIPL